MAQRHSTLQSLLAVRQPESQVEEVPYAQRAQDMQLVRESLPLVKQVPVQEAEDRGTAVGAHHGGGVGTEGERANMVW